MLKLCASLRRLGQRRSFATLACLHPVLRRSHGASPARSGHRPTSAKSSLGGLINAQFAVWLLVAIVIFGHVDSTLLDPTDPRSRGPKCVSPPRPIFPAQERQETRWLTPNGAARRGEDVCTYYRHTVVGREPWAVISVDGLVNASRPALSQV